MDCWGILGSSSSCHCSREGSPSSGIPAWISIPPGMPREAKKPMMAMARSSSSLRACAVFTPAPVKLVCCQHSDAFFFVRLTKSCHFFPTSTSDLVMPVSAVILSAISPHFLVFCLLVWAPLKRSNNKPWPPPPPAEC